MAKPTVTIPEAEYKELLADSHHLNMLINRGVDNWDGYVGRGHEECQDCGFDLDECECHEECQDCGFDLDECECPEVGQ